MEILSSSYINEMIYNFKSVEIKKRLSSIQTKKSNFSSLSSTITDVSSKVTSLLSSLDKLKATSSSSIFNTKSALSSNESYLTATADKTANIGSYELFVTQLAKNDMVISQDVSSSAVSGLTGKHSFTVKTGDGTNADFTSTISVDLDGTETNSELLSKISSAINTDYVEVNSSAKTAANNYTGNESTIKINLNGTDYSINVTGGGTYEQLIDELVENINSGIDGINAEKVLDDPSTGDVRLKVTGSKTTDYISISHDSGFDLVTDLGIQVDKEVGAASVLSASSFAPGSDTSQLSITSKNSGLDYRIKSIADNSGSTILAQLGLNLGSSRPSFDQSIEPDTAGFVYSDITNANNQLNAKFSFNNVQIQKNSNTVSDLVSGMTFNIKSVMKDTDPKVNITVEHNNETIRNDVNDFIKKFNDVYTLLKEKTKSTETSRGILRGEATVSSLLNSLRSIGHTTFGDSDNEFRYLSQIGIKFDATTGLSISDSTLFDDKVNNNTSEVENLFNSSNGLATTLYDSLKKYSGAEGYLSLAKQSYDNSAKYLSDRIDSVTTSIDKSAEVLRKRYQSMQTQLATLLSTQSFFGTGSNY